MVTNHSMTRKERTHKMTRILTNSYPGQGIGKMTMTVRQNTRIRSYSYLPSYACSWLDVLHSYLVKWKPNHELVAKLSYIHEEEPFYIDTCMAF